MIRDSLIVVLASVATASPLQAAAEPESPSSIMDEINQNRIREVSYDICLPADAAEYEALGKNAVILITARSALATELPLKSAYLEIAGVKFPIQKFVRSEVRSFHDPSTGNEYAEQVYFYLVPISLLKRESILVVDFTGPRTGFSVSRITAESFSGAPAFIRLDEYDTPSEANMQAVATMLAREYPTFFPGK